MREAATDDVERLFMYFDGSGAGKLTLPEFKLVRPSTTHPCSRLFKRARVCKLCNTCNGPGLALLFENSF